MAAGVLAEPATVEVAALGAPADRERDEEEEHAATVTNTHVGTWMPRRAGALLTSDMAMAPNHE